MYCVTRETAVLLIFLSSSSWATNWNMKNFISLPAARLHFPAEKAGLLAGKILPFLKGFKSCFHVLSSI